MSVDYSKWDVLADETDREEEKAKLKRRMDNKNAYMKDQAERQAKYKAEQAAKRAREAAEHGHEHHHHEHNHDEEHALHRSCGCGYADPEELKKIAAENAKKPQISIEEKNDKKIKAVMATREHGNQLFKEGSYEHAFAVYERGVLIINGMYGQDDKTYTEMNKMECLLDLNMAMCKLKLKDWTKAIENCKMALNIDKTNVKAMYRLGLAYIGMGEYLTAREHFQAAQKVQPDNKEVKQQLARIKQLLVEQKEKEKAFALEMAQRMQKQQQKEAARHKAEQLQSTADDEEDNDEGEEEGVERCSGDAEKVQQFLARLGYSDYTQAFLDEGFDSLSALKVMTLEDLLAVGVKRGHCRVIMAALDDKVDSA